MNNGSEGIVTHEDTFNFTVRIKVTKGYEALTDYWIYEIEEILDDGFKRFDYVYFNDYQMDGYLYEYLGDGIWDVQYTTGTGGGNMHIHEAFMEKCYDVPKYYQDIINYVKGCEEIATVSLIEGE